jgi:hypothetical protein
MSSRTLWKAYWVSSFANAGPSCNLDSIANYLKNTSHSLPRFLLHCYSNVFLPSHHYIWWKVDCDRTQIVDGFRFAFPVPPWYQLIFIIDFIIKSFDQSVINWVLKWGSVIPQEDWFILRSCYRNVWSPLDFQEIIQQCAPRLWTTRWWVPVDFLESGPLYRHISWPPGVILLCNQSSSMRLVKGTGALNSRNLP